MNEMKVFESTEFGKIRAMEIGGEPWFVGKDVAAALGYGRATKAIQDHVDKEDADEVPIQDSIGRMQKTPIINESGLYSLILSSKLPTAKRFKRWVTAEVLPSIRKHGAYMTPETLEAAILNPDTLIKVCMALKSEQEQRRALEAKVEADRPKVEFADAVYDTKGAITVEKFAKLLHDKEHLQIGRNRLYALLRSLGYLKGNNMPYQNYLDAGYFETCEVMRYGNPYVMTLITGKGQRRLFDQIVRHYSTARI